MKQSFLRSRLFLAFIINTGSKDWPAWEMNYEEANKTADRIPNLVSISIEENGPARVAFKVVTGR